MLTGLLDGFKKKFRTTAKVVEYRERPSVAIALDSGHFIWMEARQARGRREGSGAAAEMRWDEMRLSSLSSLSSSPGRWTGD